MKRHNPATGFISWLLSFTLSASGALCLATGFRLTVDDLSALVWVCSLTALVCSVLFQWRRGGIVFLLVSALLCGWLWRLEIPDRQLMYLVQHISQIYDNAYHWGSLQLSDFPQSVDFPLMILGYLIAAAVSHCICRGNGCFMATAVTLLPLILCLVVTDTVPDSVFLFSLLAGLGILILTSGVRRQSMVQGNRLTALAAVPVLLLTAALFLAAPREGYVNRSAALRQEILAWAEEIPAKLEATAVKFTKSVTGAPQQRIDLTNLGSRSPLAYPVMTVTSQSSGTLYLRGRDYDSYTGTGWNATGERTEAFTRPDIETGTVTIRTRRVQDLLYIPYYPVSGVSLQGGAAINASGAQEYHFPTGVPAEGQPEGKYAVLPDSGQYLRLPEGTADRLTGLLETILPPEGSSTECAGAIAEYVRNCAQYDLTPDIMGPEDPEFAHWFLTQADRGYCVHFATTAAVLLRAAGIPARYVTGYMTTTQAGESVTVTEKDAHAWVEYYEPKLDAWLILEATPAAPETGETTPSAAPTETQSPPTQTVPEATIVPHTGEETAGEETVPPPEKRPELTASDRDLAGLKSLAGILLWLGLGLLSLSGQRAARLALRRYLRETGQPNHRALALWKEAELLSRLLKEPPTEELLQLAQKAKFSQHDLRDEELALFDSYLRACRQQLKKKPWYLRLVHQYIFAAY